MKKPFIVKNYYCVIYEERKISCYMRLRAEIPCESSLFHCVVGRIYIIDLLELVAKTNLYTFYHFDVLMELLSYQCQELWRILLLHV